jgi:riboflavin kinase / FMN adenylyltransferase
LREAEDVAGSQHHAFAECQARDGRRIHSVREPTPQEHAGALGASTAVLTFEPHPRQVFRPDVPLFRLTPAPMKARLLAALGFDAVVEQAFTREFSSFAPEGFVAEVLLGGLGASHVVTGFDFHYGKGRGGTPETLAAEGRAHGFGVTVVDAFSDEGGERARRSANASRSMPASRRPAPRQAAM